jgi:uncharacterized protein YcsI (UPF0317 family)
MHQGCRTKLGSMAQSMRPLMPADAIRAGEIYVTFAGRSRCPSAHHLPDAIGARDLSRPDCIDPPEIEDNQLPVFLGAWRSHRSRCDKP